jgi:hypothetical protein
LKSPGVCMLVSPGEGFFLTNLLNGDLRSYIPPQRNIVSTTITYQNTNKILVL